MEGKSTIKTLGQQAWVKHSAIVFGILFLMTVGIFMLRNNAIKMESDLTEPLTHDLEIDNTGNEEMMVSQQKELALLVELFDFIKTRREHNRKVYLTMYTYHFTSTTMLLILSSISTILLLIVAQQGIANTKPYFKTVFFTVAFITTVYAVIPQVYDFEENIETNFDLYRGYEQLRYDIYLHAKLMKQGGATEELQDFPEFYAGVIHELRELINIGIKFDAKSITSPNFSESQPGF